MREAPPGYEVFAFDLGQLKMFNFASNALFCDFKFSRLLFVLQCCVYLAMITSTSENVHKTDLGRNKGKFPRIWIRFVGEHIDFQPVCPSQFEFGKNVFWGWEGSRLIKFINFGRS